MAGREKSALAPSQNEEPGVGRQQRTRGFVAPPVVAAYWAVTRETGLGDTVTASWLNGAALVMIFSLTYTYRGYRQRLRLRGVDPEPAATTGAPIQAE